MTFIFGVAVVVAGVVCRACWDMTGWATGAGAKGAFFFGSVVVTFRGPIGFYISMTD